MNLQQNKQTVPCRLCGAELPIVAFGFGYVATCSACHTIAFNDAALPVTLSSLLTFFSPGDGSNPASPSAGAQV